MALAFGIGASEQCDRRASAQRGLNGLRVALSLCSSRPSAGRTASRGTETLRASVMDYRRLLMSRVVPGQFDDADSSDRWAGAVGHIDFVGILLSPPLPRAFEGDRYFIIQSSLFTVVLYSPLLLSPFQPGFFYTTLLQSS